MINADKLKVVIAAVSAITVALTFNMAIALPISIYQILKARSLAEQVSNQ